ncbi:TetR family transcriptional regulator [Novosphingobium mangrovi (ex Huang et al. 2023)]|uniref:TetR family transcriptional regulator n=1 Tax=Novosphingobium mangrovi (ex Huang et al. 2023) TaxID=2976432 RepID=A0ABT2I1Q6_9SPHN|nr:TetR family transcriptional regulator [Novosphingobium mangrovi (ex Huang et al. 2023)]MCT2398725.1 TetR family transcriptional regulator [Novosphingobium mangrovi (ex Huang et al. 2023)]
MAKNTQRKRVCGSIAAMRSASPSVGRKIVTALMNCPESVAESSYDRFVSAVMEQWETQGTAGISARQISVATGVPVSSIYHYFGSMEQLLDVSQKAALASAKGWCDEQLQQLAGFAGAPDAFPGFFAQIVDGWAHEQRRLAFAWRECQLLALRNASFGEVSKGWDNLWAGFWSEVARIFGLGRGRIVIERVFENESFLHMIRWRRMIDRAALDETARALGAWLSGSPTPAAPWREFAREEAIRSMPSLPERDETAARIVAVAAELIGISGVARLTHRAVAERAGLTLGTVSHKFRTKSALIEAAFEGIYTANLERIHGKPSSLPAFDTRNPQAVRDSLTDMICRGASSRGGDELFVAVARDPSLSPFGAQLRYLRGRSSRGVLQAIVGAGREIGTVEAALFSSFSASQIRVYANMAPDLVEARVREEWDVLLGFLMAASGAR